MIGLPSIQIDKYENRQTGQTDKWMEDVKKPGLKNCLRPVQKSCFYSFFPGKLIMIGLAFTNDLF